MTEPTSGLYPPKVNDVLNILKENEIPFEVRLFDTPARQASQAAALLGCPLGAIVKSLVFENKTTGGLFLVLVSGQNRADTHILSTLVGAAVGTAKPETVLSKTGFPVGAVPPIGISDVGQTIIDADLMTFQYVWGSAGEVNALLRVNSPDLLRLTAGQVEMIKQG
jgi:prolyl-tRNA editing enzyme YbaK/EbsC (Cys-tRNA(Pro) deacylase)